jgi:hypothetical protein
MKFSDIPNYRLLAQQIESPKFKSAKDLISYMGALQAQDYQMAKWAVGLRVKKSTDKKIEKAVHNGDIIRTHLMRPTWHFVSADDIYWMLELTTQQMKTAAKSRQKFLGLTEKIVSKSNNIIEKSLRDGNHLTRDELMKIIAKQKIQTTPEFAIHLMYRAETDGIVCSGKIKNNKQTYALLAERVPKNKNFIRDESLALLAKKYFTSHCPATLKDFIWWSGLPAKDAMHALEMVKSNFISEKIGNEIYWLTNSFKIKTALKNSVHLLPAFDEFLISYKDRTASLMPEHHKNALSTNGIFWPVIVVNGKVIGKWKRTFKKEKVIIETEIFEPQSKMRIAHMQKSAEKFGKFLERESEILID